MLDKLVQAWRVSRRVAGWLDQFETRLNSASVEVEAELGKKPHFTRFAVAIYMTILALLWDTKIDPNKHVFL